MVFTFHLNYLATFIIIQSDHSNFKLSTSQVGRVCVENCQQFDGFSVTYRLEVPDKNVSADVQSCYAAVSITQAPDEMWGLLFVNDSDALRRPECQNLQYLVVAQEEHTLLEASTQIHIILHSDGENVTAISRGFKKKFDLTLQIIILFLLICNLQ